jgi:hypothetical protein
LPPVRGADLVVAAAYLQEHDAYGKAGWGS